MRIGVLTGGGDCPGLNAVIRGIVRRAERRYGDQIIGFRDGYSGVLDCQYMELTVADMQHTLPLGGTILGTSRTNPFKYDDGLSRTFETFEKLELDGLIAVGGEGTLSCSNALFEKGLKVLAVPKTIDNDIGITERTFGFDTAVAIATEAIDRLRTTAESHNRIMVVEVMGRHVGHIATWAGIASGATRTLIPEEPFDIAEVCSLLTQRHEGGRYASVVVVAEGAKPIPGTMEVPTDSYDEFGHVRLGGIAARVAAEIENRTGYETRVTVLGHVQRGGTPTAYDRVLSTRFGVAAVDAAHQENWGKMVALLADQIEVVDLGAAVSELKPVAEDLWDTAKQFFN